jgi:DNA gyrase subunit A
MIVNKSGITIRMAAADLRVMGRATQGVRLINLKGKDEIASVCRVPKADEEEIPEIVEGADDAPEGVEGVQTPETQEIPDTPETTDTSEEPKGEEPTTPDETPSEE